MATHTPGPWTRTPGERFHHDESAGIRGPDNMYVAAAFDFNRSDRDAEVEANALLIAAAPEMFAALEAVLDGHISRGSGPIAPTFDRDDWEVERSRGAWDVIDHRAYEQVRAAVAKATGQVIAT